MQTLKEQVQNRKNEERVSKNDPARLRWGDIFAPTKDRKREFIVRHIYTFDGTVETQTKEGLWITMKAFNIERGLQDGSIIIIKDGPEIDTRLESL